jgi:hypothetical protein
MSGASDEVFFRCGCTADIATGLPISTCRRHDQRTREVRASAALMQMGLELDLAGGQLACTQLLSAAKYAVKAAKALIGSEE